jgi:hypothetical protein
VPIFPVAFSSREMLVKRKLLFLLITCITRNGVPSPADFRHFTEICMVDSHVSRRCASHSPHKSSNIRAIYHVDLQPDAPRGGRSHLVGHLLIQSIV